MYLCVSFRVVYHFFFFNDTATTEIYTLSLHDALPIYVQAGALVLFTSREQMRLAVDALSTAMRSQVLVQTAMPRALLLARHRDAVEMGEPSIIFGMQSFGEEIGRASCRERV